MLVYEKNSLSEEIELLIERFGKDRVALLPILQIIEKRHNYISEFAQQEVARLLDIHPVEVYSVVSFYNFLHRYPQGKNIVRLCKTISCDMAGKQEIEKALKRELGINFDETTRDKKWTLEYTSCLGMCDQGPAMLVNDKIYTKLDPETAVKILNDTK
ncbi:MAG: NAD(P)H-dependent oxidoreductase subunit E [Ignavibacteria bacterium]|jgi:[NiFe] hydrogenase diaphorase moiety large subunit|nr:NAD(P)H-dependent oxidoreductase subunit E [Ignavibacteria bacterium]